MKRAVVVGSVWATKRLQDFPAGALLELEVVDDGDHLVALDVLGSGIGEEVLVATGSAVANHLPGNTPVDALVIGVIDEPINPAGKSGKIIKKGRKS